MTSRKKRKRSAQARGLTESELQLCELLEEVLAALRWTQVLGWGNQYLLNQRLEVTPEERDRVMRAAAAAVEGDARLADWGQRLAEIKQKLSAIDTGMRSGDAGMRSGDAGSRSGDASMRSGNEAAGAPPPAPVEPPIEPPEQAPEQAPSRRRDPADGASAEAADGA